MGNGTTTVNEVPPSASASDAAIAASGLRRRASSRVKEKLIEFALFLAALSSVLTTIAIVVVLVEESVLFFQNVPIWDFVTGTEWTPLFDNPKYGILPLLMGTLVTSAIALLVAVPMGTVLAMYLSEFAGFKAREIAKPFLELLAGVPTVVYGYFALLFVTPILQSFLPSLPGFNMLSAGLVMGIMIVPYVSSICEDAMRAVPMALREGSFAMGATRLQTSAKVVVPAAFSGIAAAYILGVSRAVGETMVLAIAAGNQPNFTLNPMEPAQTITAYIVAVSLGDLPHGGVGYQTIFAAGLTLMLMTLGFNIGGHWLRRKYREAY
jgi:phosphate transport system permease protein